MSQPEQTFHAEHGGRRFRIVPDPQVGFYLFVYEGTRCTHDYLQDTLDGAREFARQSFGVPVHVWSHERAEA